MSGVLRELALTNALAGRLVEEIKKKGEGFPIHFNLGIETQIAGLLAMMERDGIGYDDGVQGQHEKTIKEALGRLESEAHGMVPCGEALNLRSPLQLSKVFYDELKAPLLPSKTSRTCSVSPTHRPTRPARELNSPRPAPCTNWTTRASPGATCSWASVGAGRPSS